MSFNRSPQSLNPASLNISSPRSLRPREQLHAPAPRYHPSTPQQLYTPDYVPESMPDDQREYQSERPTQEAASDLGTPESRSRMLVGGLVNRLRRIPGAFAKHHSRESLYSEYLAEAQEMASQGSRRLPSRSEYGTRGNTRQFGLTDQPCSHLSGPDRHTRKQRRSRIRPHICWLR